MHSSLVFTGLHSGDCDTHLHAHKDLYFLVVMLTHLFYLIFIYIVSQAVLRKPGGTLQ